jgi:hypothetical protein
MAYKPKLTVTLEEFDAKFTFATGLGMKEYSAFDQRMSSTMSDAPRDDKGMVTLKASSMPLDLSALAAELFEAACIGWEGVDLGDGPNAKCNDTNKARLPAPDKATLGFAYWAELQGLGESVPVLASPAMSDMPPSSPSEEVGEPPVIAPENT